MASAAWGVLRRASLARRCRRHVEVKEDALVGSEILLEVLIVHLVGVDLIVGVVAVHLRLAVHDLALHVHVVVQDVVAVDEVVVEGEGCVVAPG